MPVAGHGAASGRRPAARREHGAAALEFAIVGSVFFFLVFAIVDGGLVFNDYLSIGYGSKDAARQAVVGTTGSDSGCTLTGAGGAGTSTKQLLCLTKDRVGLGQADTRVKLAFGSQGYAEGADLAVCVQYKLRSRSGVLSTVFDDMDTLFAGVMGFDSITVRARAVACVREREQRRRRGQLRQLAHLHQGHRVVG